VDMRSLTFSVMGIFVVTAAGACGKPFTATGGTGGSSTSSGSMMSSSSGPACTVGDLTSCGMPGHYCADTMPTSCVPCTDLTRFAFGQPQQINLELPDMTSVNPNYPRIGQANGQPNALYFTYNQTAGMMQNQEIGHAESLGFLKWGKGAAEPALINTTVAEGGALFLPNGDAIMNLVGGAVIVTNPHLLFHRIDSTAIPATAKLYATDGLMIDEIILPELDPLLGVTRNYNIAVAPKATPGRLWYVSNINKIQMDDLVTIVPGDSMAKTVEVKLENNCVAVSPFNPWVDETGSLLLISSPDSDIMNNCKPFSVPSLYYIDIKKAANMLMLDALPVFPGDKNYRTTPSMSDDLCVLYYTELMGTTNHVFSAIRQ
jgi:hypothetical protein